MGVYITSAEVIAEGAPASLTTRIDARILKWERVAERLTRNVFRVTSPGPLVFVGDGISHLQLPKPLIEVTDIKANGSKTSTPLTDFQIYNRNNPIVDDRMNPRIVYNESVFTKNVGTEITATWGYVDPDPANPGGWITPAPIKAILIALVMLDLDSTSSYAQNGGLRIGMSPLKREKTDKHEIEYQQTQLVKVGSMQMPMDLYEQLMLFRCPYIVRTVG